MMQYKTHSIDQKIGISAFLTYPLWESFDPASLVPELRLFIDEGRAFADALGKKKEHTFASLILASEDHDERLGWLWGTAMHLNNVAQTDLLREACKEGTQLLSEYMTDIGQHEGLYHAYLAYRGSGEYRTLGSAEKKIIDDAIDAFERSGVGLPKEKKARLKEINKLLAGVEENFENNLIDAVEAWSKHVTDGKVLSGIPEETREQMRRKATADGLPGYVLTLSQPAVIAVITHADDRALREEVYIANNTRTSELGQDPTLDNGPLIMRILALRDEKAKLLGFANYAELSLEKKMAPSVHVVLGFLERLAEKSYASARKEFGELQAFASAHLGLSALEPWDIAYASEKFRLVRYNVSDEELRPYFPATKVFRGMFDLIGRIYGMRVEEDHAVSVWRNDVKFYRVYDDKGDLRGGFYADLYAREKKRGGAWMDDCIQRRKIASGIQLPIAYLNCNFTEPKSGSDGYLTHAEVETTFHEFGHVLHHILGKTEYASAGMMHVEWDAVECPSQVMENWCWDKVMLRSLSAHRETGAEIPDELCDRLLSAKYFQAALATVRQLEFSIIDMELHAKYDPAEPQDPRWICAEVWKRVRVTPVYKNDRFLNTFSHIFSGGYSAGYYSYKWAEVLAADIYEAYVETGDVFNPGIGALFLGEVLEVGSSRPMMESFKKFRGREPSEDALLRQSGLVQ